MGAWGTGIFHNDTTNDIWIEFKELYNKGFSPSAIRVKLEKEYNPQNDSENYGEIWTAIAYGQWMCNDLEDYAFKKLIDTTKLKRLKLYADDEKQLKKRIQTLKDFIDKVQVQRTSTLKRKNVTDRPIIYKKGDVIAQKIDEKKYLAAIVVEVNDHPNYLENTIVLTDLMFSETPTQQQILDSKILYLDIGGVYNYHRGFYRASFTTKNMAKKAKSTILVGKLKIKKYLSLGVGIGVGDWNKIGLLFNEQIEFLKQNKSDNPFQLTVKDLLDPNQKLQDELYDWSKKIYREKLTPINQNGT